MPTIEKGVPITKSSRSGRALGPTSKAIATLLTEGEFEDSIFIAVEGDEEAFRKKQANLRNASQVLGRRYGFKLPIRREQGGFRVWKGAPRQ